jgi:hypothetical protein
MNSHTKTQSNLWKLALFSLMIQAISLWAEPQHFSSGASSGQRKVNGAWSPHAMIAGLLERTNGPHQSERNGRETWRNAPPDKFQQEHQFLTARLKNNWDMIDEAELEYLKSRADRMVFTITKLKETTEKIKSETDNTESDRKTKTDNADKLIEALTIQLGDWNNLQIQIDRLSQKAKKRAQ